MRTLRAVAALVLTFGILGAIAVPMGAAEPSLIPVNLGVLPDMTASDGRFLNEAEQVTGISFRSGLTKGFFWTPENGMTDLGGLGGTRTEPADLNELGVVVGRSLVDATAFHAFKWSSGTLTDLGTLGGANSEARAVNNAGRVVGFAENAAALRKAVVWDETVASLGSAAGDGGRSEAFDVNDAGHVVGITDAPDGTSQGFFWDGTMHLIGTLPGGARSVARFVNEFDLVAGVADNATGAERAVVWTMDVGLVDLGSLGGRYVFPSDLNNRGELVGTGQTPLFNFRAFRASVASGVQLLPLAGGPNSVAAAINDAGIIVGAADGFVHGGVVPHPTRWEGDSYTELPPLGTNPLYGSSGGASDVNEAGDVAGRSSLETLETHATLWGTPPPLAIGTLAATNGNGVLVPRYGSTVSTAIRFEFETFDPARAATFVCTLDGDTSPCANPQSYEELEIGWHVFRVQAFDDAGVAGPERSFAWFVISPADATSRLMNAVVAEDLPSGTTNSLLDPLGVAYNILTNAKTGDDGKACRQLRSFEDQVALYLVKGRLTEDQARRFATASWEIRVALGCG